MACIRIVLADDHHVVRAGLRALIDAQPDMEVVAEAGDGVELLARAAEARPDLVVMDLSMPRLTGLAATERLRERAPASRILVLSVHEDAAHLRRVLAAGATGYVLKRAAAEALIGAIRVVSGGGVYLDLALSGALVQGLPEGNARADGAPALSAREDAVLRLIALGYSNKEIAGRLDLSIKTVETYKARAMEKLSLASRVELVRYAAEHGWLRV